MNTIPFSQKGYPNIELNSSEGIQESVNPYHHEINITDGGVPGRRDKNERPTAWRSNREGKGISILSALFTNFFNQKKFQFYVYYETTHLKRNGQDGG
jgi:hypothetical protein